MKGLIHFVSIMLCISMFGCNSKTSKKKEQKSLTETQTQQSSMENNSSNKEGEKNSKIVLKSNTSKKEIVPIEKTKFPISDTLYYHLHNNSNLDAKFYNNIFDKDYILSDIDKVFVKHIKPKTNGINPVILSFQTVESDRKKEYIDLHLFNEDWILKKSLSLEYDVDYDLFHQEYKFISDSIIEVKQDHGLSYDNDSTVQKIFTLKIDKIKLLDTIKVQIDTLNM
ncbi:hypothetical protein [Aquimarina sp. 2304DJ70-9]|uniref:hypothetical protein n=1 Tax=Aquimarina penaris TaxID=3231044 RepID=UPI0034637FD8